MTLGVTLGEAEDRIKAALDLIAEHGCDCYSDADGCDGSCFPGQIEGALTGRKKKEFKVGVCAHCGREGPLYYNEAHKHSYCAEGCLFPKKKDAKT